MRAIHKYPLDGGIGAPVHAWLPDGAVIRHCAMQHGVPMLWAEVETDTLLTARRTFVVVGTGHPIPDGWVWLATLMDPPFVWHVGEVFE